jgi:thermostable 8-oxoguanine DNA glycosylase
MNIPILKKKRCRRCNVLKTTSDFYKNGKRICKDCIAIINTDNRRKDDAEAIEKLNTKIKGLSLEEAMHYLWPKYRLGEIKRSHLDVVLDHLIKVH